MKKLIFLLFIFCTLAAAGQSWTPIAGKQRFGTGLGIPVKDSTLFLSAADTALIYINKSDTTGLYWRYKGKHQKVGGGTVSGTTNYVAKFTSSTAIGNSQIFDNGTGVGIGTASPATDLQISRAGSSTVRLTNTSNSTNMELGISTALGFIGTQSNSAFALNTNNVERIRITSGGNVGINQTAPAAQFVANGTTLINTNTDNGVDKLQVSGSAIASELKVNTNGQTALISTRNAGSGFENLWIGGGGQSATNGGQNTSLGINALLSTTSGYQNTAIGHETLRLTTTGCCNDAFGQSTLRNNTTGSSNTGFGNSALYYNTTGSTNAAIGTLSLGSLTSGNNNVGIGPRTLYNITTQSNNIAIGVDAGRYISGGGNNTGSSQSIFIGEDTRASAASNTNEMVFGHTAIGQGSNTVTLGNSSITKTFLRGNTMVNTTTDNGVDELQVNGSIQGTGFNQAYTAKTGTYTAATTDYVIDCTTGTFTVNLFTAVGNTGRILIIKNSGSGTITIDPNGSQTIDGNTTITLTAINQSRTIISDGANWKIIGFF